MDEIVGIIQSVGFPIVAYLLMFGLVRNQLKTNTDALHELKEAIVELKTVILKRG